MKQGNMKDLNDYINGFEPITRAIPRNQFLTNNFIPKPKKVSFSKRVKRSLSDTYSRYKKYVSKKIKESFIGKINTWFIKKVEERKKIKEEKLLRANFSKVFKTDYNTVKSIMNKTQYHSDDNEIDLINSAKKYNEVKRFKSPNFVDFDVIDIHNENRNLKSKTIEELKHEDNDESTYQLKKQERLVNESFYINETLGQKIKRLNIR